MTESSRGASQLSTAQDDAHTHGTGYQAGVPVQHQFAKDASASFVSSISRLAQLVEDTQGDESKLKGFWPQMRGIKQGLDRGKYISGAGKNRGIPLALTVQLLKASWHADSTWPIGEHALEQRQEQAIAGREPGPQARPDPSPDEIAAAYRKRGISVSELPLQTDDSG